MVRPMSNGNDPIAEFIRLFTLAKQQETSDATAMTVATAGADGCPHARMLLLKQVDERGFVFYSNRNSPKGEQLKENPRAALCFHWPVIKYQIRVEGPVGLAGDDESDAYYWSRARGSQLGAWASYQSQPLANRAELVARYLQLKMKHAGRRVPRPPHWGGYRLVPLRIEIWKDGHFRLHDRFNYTRPDEQSPWKCERLSP